MSLIKMGCKTNYSKILKLIIFVFALLFPIAGNTKVFAQTEQSSPLEITSPDPLLPQPSVDRPLSPLERFRLNETLNDINTQATEQLNAGNDEEAFKLWYRELRLSRALGPLEEVQALGRVGEIAWDKNRHDHTKIIAKRLQVIQEEAQKETALDPSLLAALGEAYQQVRTPQSAVKIYQQILALARDKGDSKTIEETLKIVGQLHLAWFDYPNAAATYEELLTLAQKESDRFHESVYLQELAYIYDRAIEPENGLRIKEQLAENYRREQNLEKLPALNIAIADDREALQQPDAARQKYQEAFTLAWETTAVWRC